MRKQNQSFMPIESVKVFLKKHGFSHSFLSYALSRRTMWLISLNLYSSLRVRAMHNILRIVEMILDHIDYFLTQSAFIQLLRIIPFLLVRIVTLIPLLNGTCSGFAVTVSQRRVSTSPNCTVFVTNHWLYSHYRDWLATIRRFIDTGLMCVPSLSSSSHKHFNSWGFFSVEVHRHRFYSSTPVLKLIKHAKLYGLVFLTDKNISQSTYMETDNYQFSNPLTLAGTLHYSLSL